MSDTIYKVKVGTHSYRSSYTNSINKRLPAGEHLTLGGQGRSARQIFGCREQTSSSAHPPFSSSQDGRQKAASDPPNGSVYVSQVAWEGQLNSPQGPGQETLSVIININHTQGVCMHAWRGHSLEIYYS